MEMRDGRMHCTKSSIPLHLKCFLRDPAAKVRKSKQGRQLERVVTVNMMNGRDHCVPGEEFRLGMQPDPKLLAEQVCASRSTLASPDRDHLRTVCSDALSALSSLRSVIPSNQSGISGQEASLPGSRNLAQTTRRCGPIIAPSFPPSPGIPSLCKPVLSLCALSTLTLVPSARET